jgi:hypothetical protein
MAHPYLIASVSTILDQLSAVVISVIGQSFFRMIYTACCHFFAPRALAGITIRASVADTIIFRKVLFTWNWKGGTSIQISRTLTQTHTIFVAWAITSFGRTDPSAHSVTVGTLAVGALGVTGVHGALFS